MSSLHDSLKKITIIEILIVLLALMGSVLLFDIFGYSIGEDWVYIGLILYFIYRLHLRIFFFLLLLVFVLISLF